MQLKNLLINYLFCVMACGSLAPMPMMAMDTDDLLQQQQQDCREEENQNPENTSSHNQDKKESNKDGNNKKASAPKKSPAEIWESEPTADDKLWCAITEMPKDKILDFAARAIDQGADVNTINLTFPLRYAAYSNNLPLVKLLLIKGADHKKTLPNDGKTALDVAKELNRTDIIELLEEIKDLDTEKVIKYLKLKETANSK
jgi:ankyrin repeat protein